MNTNAEFTQEVNKLIEKNNGACLGYRNAAENVNNDALKSFLQRQAEKRLRYANDLKQEVRAVNPAADLDNSGSLKGDIHRGWMNVKAAFTNENEEEVLEECLRGERASLEEYHEVLDKVSTLPDTIATKIREQHQEIHDTVQTVKRLEDLHDNS